MKRLLIIPVILLIFACNKTVPEIIAETDAHLEAEVNGDSVITDTYLLTDLGNKYFLQFGDSLPKISFVFDTIMEGSFNLSDTMQICIQYRDTSGATTTYCNGWSPLSGGNITITQVSATQFYSTFNAVLVGYDTTFIISGDINAVEK